MNSNMLISWFSFLITILIILGLDLLRGRKSKFAKYIDSSGSIYEFAENISMFMPNVADEVKREEIKTKLEWSGNVLGLSVGGYYALIIVMGSIGLVLGLFLYPLGLSPLFSIITAILFSLIPVGKLRSSIEKRQADITMALPNMVNLLSTAIWAGIELGPALEVISYNTEGPLGEVLKDSWKEIATGKSRAEVLKVYARNTGVPMFERFVDTIVVAEERGGMELSKSLSDFSEDMKHMERKFLEEKAKKVPTKMLLPLMLCIFIPMILLLLTPIGLSVVSKF